MAPGLMKALALPAILDDGFSTYATALTRIPFEISCIESDLVKPTMAPFEDA